MLKNKSYQILTNLSQDIFGYIRMIIYLCFNKVKKMGKNFITNHFNNFKLYSKDLGFNNEIDFNGFISLCRKIADIEDIHFGGCGISAVLMSEYLDRCGVNYSVVLLQPYYDKLTTSEILNDSLLYRHIGLALNGVVIDCEFTEYIFENGLYSNFYVLDKYFINHIKYMVNLYVWNDTFERENIIELLIEYNSKIRSDKENFNIDICLDYDRKRMYKVAKNAQQNNFEKIITNNLVMS